MKMICNLHTHTFRCNHASGTEREYIENAVKYGLKTLGFSDHSPYIFPGTYYSGYRMRPELQEDYAKTLLALREEYKGVIDIKIGYEAEYYPKYFEKTLNFFREIPIDYLILGQHFILNELNGQYAPVRTEDEFILKTYVDETCEAMETNLFTYMAHPDLVLYTGDEEIYKKHYSRLIECSKKTGVPLEINLLGVRDHRHYPSDKFFSLCGELGATVCIGCDAHSPDVTVDVESFEKALKMIEKYSLNYCEKPELKPVRL